MFVIRAMTVSDWPKVKEIYEYGIEGGNATFETAAPSYEKWMETADPACHLVYEIEGNVMGWAKVLYTSARYVYRGVGEVSIYLHPNAQGKGIGKELLTALIETSEKAGYWTLKAGIFPENKGSIALHQKCGFRLVGVHKKMGEMNGVWRDNAIYERRSTTVGM
ncbi:GNAT family N-acetyltransferase [Paenisporosarcina cavernae]|uniref:N-acetyltransferase family protein n=1 Tax=Paenisporosarcina cavernae TaxID=2320858 RepID=A0A385YUA8_9BACL|nr:GNAT family N-acetyltransferase [Paenisporosarcina cavernae]AYC30465.1 N-acetyltransferase family protein [Paenisporosarcina cavernae]